MAYTISWQRAINLLHERLMPCVQRDVHCGLVSVKFAELAGESFESLFGRYLATWPIGSS